MIQFAANLNMLFQEADFLERFSLARKYDFNYVEFLFPYDYSHSKLKELIAQHDLKIELFNFPPGDWSAGERGLAALPGREKEFRQSVDTALEYAVELGVQKLHCMAGIQCPGEWQAQYDTYAQNLSYASQILKQHNIMLLIEPLNQFSVPNYFLNDFFLAKKLIDETKNLFLQFDVFHCQQIHGNITRLLEQFSDISRHYQIAGVPERFEPIIGELNYSWILEKIDLLGYRGAVGCEYIPEKDTASGLVWRDQMQSIKK